MNPKNNFNLFITLGGVSLSSCTISIYMVATHAWMLFLQRKGCPYTRNGTTCVKKHIFSTLLRFSSWFVPSLSYPTSNMSSAVPKT